MDRGGNPLFDGRRHGVADRPCQARGAGAGGAAPRRGRSARRRNPTRSLVFRTQIQTRCVMPGIFGRSDIQKNLAYKKTLRGRYHTCSSCSASHHTNHETFSFFRANTTHQMSRHPLSSDNDCPALCRLFGWSQKNVVHLDMLRTRQHVHHSVCYIICF